jgi:hypothetical protein
MTWSSFTLETRLCRQSAVLFEQWSTTNQARAKTHAALMPSDLLGKKAFSEL